MRSLALVFVTLACALASSATPAAAVDPLPDEVAVSQRTAARLNLRVGDLIEVSRESSMARRRWVRVAAIWTTPEHPADVARGDLAVRFHLPTLEALLDRTDTVDRIIIRLRDPAQAERVRDDLQAMASAYDVYTASEVVERTSQTFVVIARFHRAIGLITILASGIFLVTIMTLKLTEMRREIGALRLMGITRGTIGLTVILIAVAVAVVGGLFGAGLGALLVWGINAYYQPLFATTMRFAILTPRTIVLSSGLAGLLSLAAAAVVGARLLRRAPLEQVGR